MAKPNRKIKDTNIPAGGQSAQILALRNQVAAKDREIRELKKPPRPAPSMDIIHACKQANSSILAVNFIEQGLPIVEVQNRLTLATAVRDLCFAHDMTSGAQQAVAQAAMTGPIEALRVALAELQLMYDQETQISSAHNE